MNRKEKIDFFFAPPLPVQPGPQVSVLYLARREAQECLVGDVYRENVVLTVPGGHHRLFATTMVIVAALDLLAKFHAGKDDQGGVGERFKTFVETFLLPSDGDSKLFAEVLYLGCRNPLLHSFGLHNKKHNVLLIGNADNSIVIQRDRNEPTRFLVSVEGLFTQFIAAIWAYEAEVRKSSVLQENLERMFDDYGVLTIGQL